MLDSSKVRPLLSFVPSLDQFWLTGRNYVCMKRLAVSEYSLNEAIQRATKRFGGPGANS